MPGRPSTRNLGALPAPPDLERIWRGLSLLDAILEPQWDRRVFSFDAGGRQGSLGTLRENEGNVVYALFLPNGAAVLRGFHRDSPMNPFLHRKPRRWPGLVEGMPASLLRHADATGIEPDEVTFVIWYDTATASGWQRGRQRLPNGADPDGSEALLAPFVGAADRYLDFARSYHDRVLPRGPVVRLLRGAAVDAATVHRLNPERDAKELLREARALGFETKGPPMTAKTTKKATKKTAKKTAKAKPAARKRSVNFGEAEFTIHCLRDLVQMKIEAGIVAEARVTKDLYQELFDHAKARILAVSRS